MLSVLFPTPPLRARRVIVFPVRFMSGNLRTNHNIRKVARLHTMGFIVTIHILHTLHTMPNFQATKKAPPPPFLRRERRSLPERESNRPGTLRSATEPREAQKGVPRTDR